MTIDALANHLWQSTLFAALVALAARWFRRNRAAVRHALWLAASIRFLIPLVALVAVGEQLGVRTPAPIAQRQVSIVVETMGQPFTALGLQPSHRLAPRAGDRVRAIAPALAVAVWLAGFLIVLAVWGARWRRVAAIVRRAKPIGDGTPVELLRGIERLAGVSRPIAVRASDAPLEPGIFGIVRPVLVWPRAIGDRLDADQIATILTHEVSHVRRRDNLAAALHMVVEALFWFHPVVWWIGARLVDERERACDEAVLGSGRDAEVYATSILKACRLFVESPLPCVAGVTGSDLTRRIERIMRHRPAMQLSASRQLLVGVLAIIPIATPILVGASAHARNTAPRGTTAFAASSISSSQAPPEFEVASIKPNKSGDGRIMVGVQPGGRFTATNVPLRMLIRNAYQLQDFQIVGGPDWVSSDRFDVVAKAENDDLGDPFRAEKSGEPSRGQLMLRALLADRFKLQVHTEDREMPIFVLVVARSDGKLGPAVQKSAVDCEAELARGRARGAMPPVPPRPGDRPQCGIRMAPGNMMVGGSTLTMFASTLGMFVGRVVVDHTNLPGAYDFTLTWTPDQIANRPPGGPDPQLNGVPIDPNGPSIFTAVQEQLGLKLDSQKGPVSVLVIDRVERPTEN